MKKFFLFPGLLLLLLFTGCVTDGQFQNNSGFAGKKQFNHLGIWLWRLDETIFDSYSELAQELGNTGIHRLYIKIGDELTVPQIWEEACSESVAAVFAKRKIDLIGWFSFHSADNYNLPDIAEKLINNNYKGLVCDLDAEFSGKEDALGKLLENIRSVRESFHNAGNDQFKFYLKFSGKKGDYSFQGKKYSDVLDGFLPEFYFDKWPSVNLPDFENELDRLTQYYSDLNFDIPFYPVLSYEKISGDKLSVEQIDYFFKKCGDYCSIWRIPGEYTHELWGILSSADWTMKFSD